MKKRLSKDQICRLVDHLEVCRQSVGAALRFLGDTRAAPSMKTPVLVAGWLLRRTYDRVAGLYSKAIDVQ